MLQQTQAALHHHILQDRARRDVDGRALGSHDDNRALELHATAKIDTTGDGEVVELDHLGDGRDTRLEARHLLEVVAELDERCWTEAVGIHDELAVLDGVEIRLDEHEVGAGLDGQEAATGHVHAVSVAKVVDGGTDGRLELDDADVCLALLIGWDALGIRDDLHAQLVVLHDALDGAQVHPDVVGVEVLELLDALELVDVLLRYLGDYDIDGRGVLLKQGTSSYLRAML